MFGNPDFLALTKHFSKPLDMLAHCAYPGLYYTIYPQFAFAGQEKEQFLRITRAPKKPGDSGVQFWLAANLGEAGDEITLAPLHYVRESSFERIGAAEFDSKASQVCRDLLVPLAMPGIEAGALIGCLQVTSSRPEPQVSLFAEYGNEFFDLLWWSAA